MTTRAGMQYVFVALFVSLLLTPFITRAQEPLEGTGFAPSDFIGDQIENAVKDAVIGDVPSDDMNILTKDIYAKFLAGGYATKKEYTTCQRVANAQAETGLDNLNQKWWQGGWLNLGYKAIKYSVVIASGAVATGLNDVIAEEGRGVLAGSVEAHIRAEDPEVVEISPSNRCNAKVRAVWDKKNMKIHIIISGNCNCRDIKPRWTELTHDTLKEFKVDITADVVVKSFEVEEKNPLIFWRERRVKVFLGTKNMQVDTKANCRCGVDEPPPPWVEDGATPPEDEDPPKDGGDGIDEPEDRVDPPEDEGEGVEEGADDSTVSGIPAFVNWLLGKGTDKTEEPKDDTTGEDGGESTEEKDDTDGSQWQCGTKRDVDGRKGVTTYPYEDVNRRDASTQCGGNCQAHQECHVVPGSAGAYRDTCTYCKNVCAQGEFTNKDACERGKSDTQECVATGTNQCHALRNKKKEPPQARNCEGAVRLLLDEYMGWFDPPLTVTASSATMFHEHRCFPEEDFDTHTRQLAIKGVADAQIKAMCPTLKHKESFMTRITPGVKGVCSSTTVFTY